MKILHVAPSIERAYGGPTQSLAGYISASRSENLDVDVAAPIPAHHEVEALKLAGAGRVETFQGYGSGSSAASPSLVKWVRAQSRNYDVVHVHGLFNFISTFAARAAIQAGSPVIVRPFGTLSRYTFEHRRSGLKRQWFDRLEKPNLLRAAGAHFTTTTERDEAEWHGLDFGERAHVVPPPFTAQETVTPSSSEFSEPSRPTVFFLGRLDPVKNLEVLLKAWSIVSREIPDARLEIAGEGTRAYTEKLIRLAAVSESKSPIIFSGFLSGQAKQSALAAASVLVLPSLHENFGMVVVEAIAAGAPVVVSEHVQLRDFVASNDLGIIALDSPQSLASAILSALRDSSLRDRVRSRGRELIERVYSPAVIGKELARMYLSSLENQKKRVASR
jgi:glycosyltransferase involved in cell wall biosynthesis